MKVRENITRVFENSNTKTREIQRLKWQPQSGDERRHKEGLQLGIREQRYIIYIRYYFITRIQEIQGNVGTCATIRGIALQFSGYTVYN